MVANSAVDVGPLDSFADRMATLVTVGDKEIGVIRWEGEVFAVRNICPHMFGPVCSGTVIPRLMGPAVGVAETDPAAGVMVCPWHRWEYDLRTGVGLRDARYRLKKYRVWEQDGHVLIDVGRPIDKKGA